MKKHEFLAKLEKELTKLPDADEIVAYYEELINEAISNGEAEEVFIKHLGTPSEIRYKLHNDGSFKENIKAKKNFSAAQTLSVVTKVVSAGLYIFVLVILSAVAVGLLTGGIFSFFLSIYHLVNDRLTVVAAFYFIFRLIFQASLAIFGVLIFIYIFKDSKRQLEKLQLFLSEKLNKGGV